MPLERSNFAYVLGSSGVASWEANSFGKMFVKMLTHLHMVVYTCWCWHTLQRRWCSYGWERCGFLSALLRKLCAYFLLRRWEIWRSRGSVSRWENTHRTLASGAPDAASDRPVQTVPGPARVRHRTTGTGRRPVRPVVSVRCAGVLRPSLRMGPVSTGRYRCLASGDPQVCGTLCAWVRCAPDASGVDLQSVRWSAGDR